jgi:hypothetical protein
MSSITSTGTVTFYFPPSSYFGPSPAGPLSLSLSPFLSFPLCIPAQPAASFPPSTARPAYLLPFSFFPRARPTRPGLVCSRLLLPSPFLSLAGGPHPSGSSPTSSQPRARGRVRCGAPPGRSPPRARMPRCRSRHLRRKP